MHPWRPPTPARVTQVIPKTYSTTSSGPCWPSSITRRGARLPDHCMSPQQAPYKDCSPLFNKWRNIVLGNSSCKMSRIQETLHHWVLFLLFFFIEWLVEDSQVVLKAPPPHHSQWYSANQTGQFNARSWQCSAVLTLVLSLQPPVGATKSRMPALSPCLCACVSRERAMSPSLSVRTNTEEGSRDGYVQWLAESSLRPSVIPGINWNANCMQSMHWKPAHSHGSPADQRWSQNLSTGGPELSTPSPTRHMLQSEAAGGKVI